MMKNFGGLFRLTALLGRANDLKMKDFVESFMPTNSLALSSRYPAHDAPLVRRPYQGPG